MSPVGQEDRRCITFCLKEVDEVAIACGKLFEGSGTGGGRAYHKWTSYCIVVVGSEVRVIPVEAVLAFCGESVGEIAPWRDRVLFGRDSSADGSLNDLDAKGSSLTWVTPGTPSICGVPR